MIPTVVHNNISLAQFDADKLLAEWRTIVPFKRIVGVDTETYAITNCVSPQMVCATFYDPYNKGYIKTAPDGIQHFKELLMDDDTHIVIQNASFDTTVFSVADPQLFALITRAYKKGRIHCTKLRQMMLTVGDTWNDGEIARSVMTANGMTSLHSLAGMMRVYFNTDISASKKQDSWRLRYSELDGVPLDKWDAAAIDYAINDAHFAVLVFLAQEVESKRISERLRNKLENPNIDMLKDAPQQAYADFILNMMGAVNGIRVNPARIADASEGILQAHLEGLPETLAFGIYAHTPKSKRGVKLNKSRLQALFQTALDILELSDDPSFYNLKAGEKPNVSKITTASGKRLELQVAISRSLKSGLTVASRKRISATDLQTLELIDKLITLTVDSEGQWKQFSTFLTALTRAKLNPDDRLRFNLHGFVATGRTSSSAPNLQNTPRNGAARGCFEPNEGYVYLMADYSAAEFRTLAQVNVDEDPIGGSEIARQYQLDRSFDPHLFAAAKMYEIEKKTTLSFEAAKAIFADETHELYPTMKKNRQFAKILNFGASGGATDRTIVQYARGYKVELTIAEAANLLDLWRQVWSEMPRYFQRRDALYGFGSETLDDDYRCFSLDREGRTRYCRSKTVACNTKFQAYAARGIKEALFYIFEECYFTKKSPLYGAYPILMVHDEIVLEIPHDGSEASLERLRLAASRLSELMVKGMEKYTPDVPAEAVPVLSTRWTKDAKPVFDIYGKLCVWEPKPAGEEQPATDSARVPLAEQFSTVYADLLSHATTLAAACGADDDELGDYDEENSDD